MSLDDLEKRLQGSLKLISCIIRTVHADRLKTNTKERKGEREREGGEQIVKTPQLMRVHTHAPETESKTVFYSTLIFFSLGAVSLGTMTERIPFLKLALTAF